MAGFNWGAKRFDRVEESYRFAARQETGALPGCGEEHRALGLAQTCAQGVDDGHPAVDGQGQALQADAQRTDWPPGSTWGRCT